MFGGVRGTGLAAVAEPGAEASAQVVAANAESLLRAFLSTRPFSLPNPWRRGACAGRHGDPRHQASINIERLFDSKLGIAAPLGYAMSRSPIAARLQDPMHQKPAPPSADAPPSEEIPTAPVRRRDRRSPEARREQILSEAMRIIGERGYFGFGIRDLAQRCGMTVSGTIHHFGSKEQLLISLLERRDGEAIHTDPADYDPSGQDAASSVGQLRTALRAIVERNSRTPEVIRLFTMLRAEAIRESHPAHAWFRQRRANSIDRLAEALTPVDSAPRSTALQIVILMHGLEEEWIRSGQTLDLLAEWDAAIERLLGSVELSAAGKGGGAPFYSASSPPGRAC